MTPDAVYAIGPLHTMYDIWAWCLKRGPIVHAVCRFYKCAIEPFLSARDQMMDDGVRADDAVR